MFKKKNRVSSKINGAQKDISGEIFKTTKISHTISNDDILEKKDKSKRTIRVGLEESHLNCEESYESIFVPSEGKKSNTYRFK